MHTPLKAALALVLAALAPRATCAATVSLQNDQVTAVWTTQGKRLRPLSLHDKKTGQQIPLRGELFRLVLTNGSFLNASEFKLRGLVRTEALAANPAASRFAERLRGRQVVAELASADGNIQVTWRGILRDGSRYLREEFSFAARKDQIPLNGIMLLDTPLVNARPTGTVDGSPVVTETAFFGVEHPLSINRGEMGYVRCFLPRGTSLLAGESYECSLVVGFVSKGQMRRGFLAYLERERAHPYRPFLHYNSWYDIGYFSKYDEKAALDVINAFGEELTVKRGARLDSFLFDDGWDDTEDLVAVSFRLPQRLHDAPAGCCQIRCGTGHLAFALGRLRRSARANASSSARSRDLKSARATSAWPDRSITNASAPCAWRS